MDVKVSGGMFFNNQKRTNDLEGTLQGTVMFAQTTIIPSKPATDPADKRPHLVSLRETLALFDPISTDFHPPAGVKLSILNSSNNAIYEVRMLPPEELPNIPERVGEKGAELDILESVSFHYAINTSCELKALRCDSRHFKKTLEQNFFVKVQLSDGHLIDNLEIPDVVAPNRTMHMLFFVSNGKRSSYVHYDHTKTELRGGTRFALMNINGKWINIYEAAYKEDKAIRNFLMNNILAKNIYPTKKKGYTVDYNGTIAKNLIKENGNIRIIINSTFANRDLKFFLPKNDSENDGKVILVTSAIGKKVLVCSYSGGDIILSNGDILVFYNKNGTWIEWSDALFGAIYYGDNFWSIKIPKQYITPGISFIFKNGKTAGKLLDVEIGAPTELLLHAIDIGMLVEPRNEFKFHTNQKCQNEYFQRIPVSRLIVNQYEPIYFPKIVLPNNTTYINASTDIGDRYTGDLRNVIGKYLVSVGINMANYGIHSTIGSGNAGISSPYYRTVSQFTIHNSRGRYRNGVKIHGLSGGGTLVTVIKTCTGNEFTHELGHNWLNHHPNGFAGSIHHSSNYFGSSWGWNSVRNIFLPNFWKPVTGGSVKMCDEKKKTCLSQGSFFGHKFGRDAMSGGGSAMYRSISFFTMHTPYSLWRIQNFEAKRHLGLEKAAVFDRSSETGMSKWNSTCQCMKPWSVKPKEGEENYPRKPKEQGIPVATLIGYYDPELNFTSYIYPTLHGAYGNIFRGNSEKEIKLIANNGCFATIVYGAKRKKMKFILKGTRLNEKHMNKFHINVAESLNPRTILINCKGKIIAQREITKPTMGLKFNVVGRPL